VSRTVTFLLLVCALALPPAAFGVLPTGAKGTGVLAAGCPMDPVAADVFCPPYPVWFSLQAEKWPTTTRGVMKTRWLVPGHLTTTFRGSVTCVNGVGNAVAFGGRLTYPFPLAGVPYVEYVVDNGASGERSPNGSVNENKFFNGYPDELEENLKLLDGLGGTSTYNHYPTGWAVAFSTPFQMFKRYSQYAGGTCCPLVIHWPKGIKAKGQVRHQYHHSNDIVPTILDVVGLKMPTVHRGAKQYPMNGVSMRYSFASGNAKTRKKNQYYAMLGTRGMWQSGWKAVALHAPISGAGHFDKDKWELYHVDKDRSESENVAAKYPAKLKSLIKLWFDEAKKNFVLPLDDRTAVEMLNTPRPESEPPRTRYVYYPGTAPVPEGVAVNIRGRNYKIVADVDLTDKASGVIFAHGSRFGGHALFLKDQKLHYVYNFLGIGKPQEFVSEKLSAGKYALGMEFTREKGGKYGESVGTTKLYVDDKVVKSGPMRAQVGEQQGLMQSRLTLRLPQPIVAQRAHSCAVECSIPQPHL